MSHKLQIVQYYFLGQFYPKLQYNIIQRTSSPKKFFDLWIYSETNEEDN